MSNDRRDDLPQENMFKHFAGNDLPVIPESAVGTLEFQTAAEIEAERLSHKQAPFVEPVFSTRRDVNSPEVFSHIEKQLAALPVLILTDEDRVK